MGLMHGNAPPVCFCGSPRLYRLEKTLRQTEASDVPLKAQVHRTNARAEATPVHQDFPSQITTTCRHLVQVISEIFEWLQHAPAEHRCNFRRRNSTLSAATYCMNL
ncbi:hypothetical protein D3C87_1468150 [compost metagenome]